MRRVKHASTSVLAFSDSAFWRSDCFVEVEVDVDVDVDVARGDDDDIVEGAGAGERAGGEQRLRGVCQCCLHYVALSQYGTSKTLHAHLDGDALLQLLLQQQPMLFWLPKHDDKK